MNGASLCDEASAGFEDPTRPSATAESANATSMSTSCRLLVRNVSRCTLPPLCLFGYRGLMPRIRFANSEIPRAPGRSAPTRVGTFSLRRPNLLRPLFHLSSLERVRHDPEGAEHVPRSEGETQSAERRDQTFEVPADGASGYHESERGRK